MDMIERRGLIAAAAGGALLAMSGNSPSQANSKIESSSEGSIKLLNETNIKFRNKYDEQQAWVELKKNLERHASWMKEFDLSLEQGVQEKIALIILDEEKSVTHNPRLVESLLNDVSILLDRCVNYRQEAYEVEMAGISAASSRLIHDIVSSIDEKLISNSPQSASAEAYLNSSAATIEAFNRAASANPSALGEAFNIKAISESMLALKTALSERQALDLNKFLIINKSQRDLYSRHDLDGSAHDFSFRLRSIRTLFEQDILSAVRRAYAASVGISGIYGRDLPLPSVNDSYLNDLIVWTKNALRTVDLFSESEIEIVKNISLPISVEGRGSIDLLNAFEGLEKIRIRSIGAGFCLDAGVVPNSEVGNTTIGFVAMKRQKPVGSPVVASIPSMKPYVAGSNSATVSGPQLYNVDPRGVWDFRIAKTGISGSGKQWVRGSTIINVILSFHVMTNLRSDLNSEWWLNGANPL